MLKVSSYVYCIGEDGGTFVKIGVAKEPAKRIRELQTGNGRRLYLIAAIPGSYAEERALRYAWGHLHQHGEWHWDEGKQISTYFTKREAMLDKLDATGDISGIALSVPTASRVTVDVNDNGAIAAKAFVSQVTQALEKQSDRIVAKIAKSEKRQVQPAEALQSDYISRNDAARLFMVTTRSIDRWAREGRIRRKQLGKRRVGFSRSDIDTHIAQINLQADQQKPH